MRAWVPLGLLLIVGCQAQPLSGSYEAGLRWLDSPELRRSVLEESLVNPENLYSQVRLREYSEAGWGARPVWRPLVAEALAGASVPTEFSQAVPEDFDSEQSLVALGALAFSRYPVQVLPELKAALTAPLDCGLRIDDDGVVQGVVWVQLPNGPQPALTCAACHAGGKGVGRANAAFDLGAVIGGGCGTPSAWGPGRVDVTADGVDNPTAIPDLRPVRHQLYLHRAGTVKNSPLALAARTETLIITSLSSAVRPPRVVALGLALWMWGLADRFDGPAEFSALYQDKCGGCHGGEGLAGGLVDYETVGTDLSILSSSSRTTGAARIPSLRGLSDRGQLFSAGQAASLEQWWQGGVIVLGHFQPGELPAHSHERLGTYLRKL